MRSAAAVVLTAFCALTAACTSAQAGQPTAGGSATVTDTTDVPPSSGAPPSPVPSLPRRPAELKLDGVVPCDLFTKAQLAELKIDRVRDTENDDSQFGKVQQCAMDVDSAPYDHFLVRAITTEGIAPWLSGKRNVEGKLTSLSGFAAADFWFIGAHDTQTPDCSTAVDVAENQQLMVSANNTGDRKYTLDQLCARSEQIAAAAVATLQTLRK